MNVTYYNASYLHANGIIARETRRILNKRFEEKKTDRIYQIIVHDKKKLKYNGNNK